MSLTFDPDIHRYYLDGRRVPSVTEVLRDTGLLPPFCGGQDALDRGTAIHALCEAMDLGELDEDEFFRQDAERPEAERYRPYLDAYHRFLDEVQPEVLYIEKRLYSDCPLVAGTTDRIVSIGPDVGILDLKTLKSGSIGPHVGYQTSGYALLAIEASKRGEIYLPTIHLKRWAVALQADRRMKLVSFTDDVKDRQIFLSAVNVWHAQPK